MSSLHDGIRILRLFAMGHRSVSLQFVVDTLRLPRTSAWRLLDTLAQDGLLERRDHGRFVPGPMASSIGRFHIEANPALLTIRQAVLRLQTETRATSYAIQQSGGEALTLDLVPGREPLGWMGYIGERRSPWETASGRLMMAQMPEAEAFRILPVELQSIWPKLDAEFRRIRSDGVSSFENPRASGFVSTSVPLIVPGQSSRLALSICWAKDEVGPERRNHLFRTLTDEAEAAASQGRAS